MIGTWFCAVHGGRCLTGVGSPGTLDGSREIDEAAGSTVIEETTWIFLGSAAAFAAYALFAVGFYRVLRDPEPGTAHLLARLAAGGASPSVLARWRRTWTWVVVPALVCGFAVVLSLMNVALMPNREVEDVYALSAGVVAAVRILANLWIDPAEELAKMVPIALLAAALFDSSGIGGETWRSRVAEAGAENALAYIAVLVLLEWVLQALHARRRSAESGDETGVDDVVPHG